MKLMMSRLQNSHFDVEDLIRLQKMAFIIEIALSKARKHWFRDPDKNKQDLAYTLTNRDVLPKY